ncbi:P-loop containing nucleoside triphosphate hydrolase protein, partial [Lophiotrema nucula]
MDTIASEYSAESSTEDDSDKHCSEEDVVQSFSRPVDSRSSAFAILVMGMTGSGKSHFISRLTNGQAKVGHNLESCTPEVARHKLVSERGQEIYLLDTPGFNDSHTSDTSIVVSIALELERLYIRHNLQFAGLVYLHRITDQRVAGSSRQSMRVFERICGEKNYPNVYLVTTMWNLLDPKTADKVGQSREKTLVEKDEFFGSMSTGGAKIERDYGDQGSAREIIQQIVKQKSRFVTTLQQEMCDSKKKLVETSIGRLLEKDMDKIQDEYEKERKELSSALNDAHRNQDASS